MLLETIEKANDIKNIRKEDLGALAQEIREFLIRTISVTGGHLGSNLGAVELTMALHLALNLPEDKIIWDVELCPVSKTSQSLSFRFGKPLSP